MEPLFLQPALKDFIWGGHRLPQEYGYAADGLDKVAEAWVLSCHPQGSAVVKDGTWAGHKLPCVLKEWGAAALGARGAAFPEFPLLIKLIDAHDRLSVQVHPDDKYARRVEGEQGKTEMWYILDCEPGARLLYGVSHELTQEEFRRRIEENTLDEAVRYVPVKKGMSFSSPPVRCTPSAPASCWPRCSRTLPPPTGCPITAAWGRTASRGRCILTRRWM